MIDNTQIVLQEWNAETYHYQPTGQLISTHLIARSLTVENFTRLLDDFLNIGAKGFAEGKEVGFQLCFTHRTLQRLAICFALGLIAGLSEQEHFDARNETAIHSAKRITQMVEDGEFPMGFYT